MKLKTLARIAALISVAALFALTLGGCAPAATEEGASAGGGMLQTGIMIAALIAVFYFLMIRPESKKKKKLAELRSSIDTGDKITTIGGMVGKVISVGEEFLTFETGEDRVRIEIAKWAIQTNTHSGEEPAK
jgi:preprotein translocase subunit YajC